MEQKRWCSLHNHTVYSIKDAMATPLDYVKRVHEWNNKNGEYFLGFVATEHGYFNNPVKVYEACNDKNVNNGKTLKPIYGVELYHSLVDSSTEEKNIKYHMPIIAKTQEGLTNLYEIASYAGLHMIEGKSKNFPRTDLNNIREFGKGIIGLSGCLGGYIPKLLLQGRYNEAKELAIILNDSFDEFYLELQANDMPEQKIVNADLLRIHRETDVGIVITCDSHYVYKEDKIAHDILVKIAYGKDGFDDYAHFQTPDEIQKYCIDNDIPLYAMDNTVKIYESCNVELKPKDKKGLMPEFTVPKGYSDDTFLEEIAFKGLFERIKEQGFIDTKDRVKRLRYELDVVKMQGFSSYFLILWDWVKYCRQNNIIIGPGRGSAAGSLLAYCLKITNIDPITHGLMFERFLNPERKSAPDYKYYIIF